MKIYETVYIIYAYVCSRAACPAVQRSLHAGSSANARELAYGEYREFDGQLGECFCLRAKHRVIELACH